jgi:transposase
MQYYKDIENFVKGKQVFCGQLLKLLDRYSSARKIQIVYEAGFSGFWLYRKLTAAGYDCIITPPVLIPRTASKVKTDKRDASQLASYLSAGILKRIYVPPAEVESDRGVNRRRSQLVKKQTSCKSQIKSFLNLRDIEKPKDIKKHWSKAYMSWLDNIDFATTSDQFTFSQLIKHYRRVREDVVEVSSYLKQLSKDPKYQSNYQRLICIKGIGLITAMSFLLEIYDFSRFKKSKHFSSFLGLTPSQHSSGEHVRLGRITRQGNPQLRKALVESAWTVIKHDPHLREKYDRIRSRGTNGKKAIVAVARSLAVRLRRCLLDETDYVIGAC